MWHRSLAKRFAQICHQKHVWPTTGRKVVINPCAMTSSPKPTYLLLPDFAVCGYIQHLRAAFVSANDVGGVFLSVPARHSVIKHLLTSVGGVMGAVVNHLIVNQFDYYWPTPMFYQAVMYNADVWLRMPGSNYICILVLDGEFKLKQAGLGHLPIVKAGGLLLVPANMYYARVPPVMSGAAW